MGRTLTTQETIRQSATVPPVPLRRNLPVTLISFRPPNAVSCETCAATLIFFRKIPQSRLRLGARPARDTFRPQRGYTRAGLDGKTNSIQEYSVMRIRPFLAVALLIAAAPTLR